MGHTATDDVQIYIISGYQVVAEKQDFGGGSIFRSLLITLGNRIYHENMLNGDVLRQSCPTVLKNLLYTQFYRNVSCFICQNQKPYLQSLVRL